MYTIVVGNDKGGACKTTIATTLAGGFAAKGRRVLLIDGDGQGHATRATGFGKEAGVYRLLGKKDQWGNVIRVVPKTWFSKEDNPAGDLFLVPSNVSTQALNIELDEPMLIRQRLEQVKDLVDVVIIDTPPSPSRFIATALLAADGLIFTAIPEFWFIDGLQESIGRLENIQKTRRNAGISEVEVLGIQVSRMLPNTIVHRTGLEQITEQFGTQYDVWEPIQQLVAWMECQYFSESILTYDESGKAGEQAHQLIEKVWGKIAAHV